MSLTSIRRNNVLLVSKQQDVFDHNSKYVVVLIRLGTDTDPMDMIVQDFHEIQGKHDDQFYDVKLFMVLIK